MGVGCLAECLFYLCILQSKMNPIPRHGSSVGTAAVLNKGSLWLKVLRANFVSIQYKLIIFSYLDRRELFSRNFYSPLS
jgi:hypothetical protein